MLSSPPRGGASSAHDVDVSVSVFDPVETLKQKHALEMDILNGSMQIKESELVSQIQELENMRICAEQEVENMRSELESMQRQLSEARQKANQFENENIKIRFESENLRRKVLSSFGVASLDDVWKVSENYKRQDFRIRQLQQELIDARTRLVASGATGAEPGAPSIEEMNEKLREANDRARDQGAAVAKLEADLKRQREMHEIELTRKDAEIKKLHEELSNMQAMNTTLVREKYQVTAQAPQKRLRMLGYVSQRLEPAFLNVEKTSCLYQMYDNLSLLLRSLSDLEVETELIRKCMVNVSDETARVASQINVSVFDRADEQAVDDRVAKLKAQIKEQNERRAELEDEVQQLNEELYALMNDDKSPEVLQLNMKITSQNEQIEKLKRRIEELNPVTTPELPRRQVRRPLGDGATDL